MMTRTTAAAASLIGAQKHLAATELRMRIPEAARGGVAGDGGVCGRSAKHQRAGLVVHGRQPKPSKFCGTVKY